MNTGWIFPFATAVKEGRLKDDRLRGPVVLLAHLRADHQHQKEVANG